MSTGWDKFQENMRTEMEKKYSPKAISYIMDPQNLGSIAGADVHVSVSGTCGDKMEMWLKVKDNKVENASFCTNGCGATIACGSMITELAKGKALGEALNIGADVVINGLGGLPDDHIHCAGLASLTLKKAVIAYTNQPKEPWKRIYSQDTQVE